MQCHEIQERDNWFALCCREGSEFLSCLDAVTCTESDNELYQLYLDSLIIADGLLFVCENDTFSGCCSSAFYIRV